MIYRLQEKRQKQIKIEKYVNPSVTICTLGAIALTDLSKNIY